MRNARGENIPFYAIIWLSTWLDMKDVANLACTSTALLWTITGLDLDNSEHVKALAELSKQLTASAIPRQKIFWPQKITHSTLVEFIIANHRKNLQNPTAFIKKCAGKIVIENNIIPKHKSMTAYQFLTESLQASAFFSFLACSTYKLDINPIVNSSIYTILLGYAGLVFSGRIPLLEDLFDKNSFPFTNHTEALRLENVTEALRLENAIEPALNHLVRLTKNQ
jgi:hypothetical protein